MKEINQSISILQILHEEYRFYEHHTYGYMKNNTTSYLYLIFDLFSKCTSLNKSRKQSLLVEIIRGSTIITVHFAVKQIKHRYSRRQMFYLT